MIGFLYFFEDFLIQLEKERRLLSGGRQADGGREVGLLVERLVREKESGSAAEAVRELADGVRDLFRILLPHHLELELANELLLSRADAAQDLVLARLLGAT